MGSYSTKTLSPQLLKEIARRLENLAFGSVEIFVAGHQVTQITRREIDKVSETET